MQATAISNALHIARNVNFKLVTITIIFNLCKPVTQPKSVRVTFAFNRSTIFYITDYKPRLPFICNCIDQLKPIHIIIASSYTYFFAPQHPNFRLCFWSRRQREHPFVVVRWRQAVIFHLPVEPLWWIDARQPRGVATAIEPHVAGRLHTTFHGLRQSLQQEVRQPGQLQ